MMVDRQRWEANPKAVTVAPMPSSQPTFIKNALLGRMTPDDQAYMARAILALSDENAEMKERVRALELVVSRLANTDHNRPAW